MRRVLIVSPSFPPISAADLHRVRMSLPYYREFGWEPIGGDEPDPSRAPLDRPVFRPIVRQ